MASAFSKGSIHRLREVDQRSVLHVRNVGNCGEDALTNFGVLAQANDEIQVIHGICATLGFPVAHLLPGEARLLGSQ